MFTQSLEDQSTDIFQQEGWLQQMAFSNRAVRVGSVLEAADSIAQALRSLWDMDDGGRSVASGLADSVVDRLRPYIILPGLPTPPPDEQASSPSFAAPIPLRPSMSSTPFVLTAVGPTSSEPPPPPPSQPGVAPIMSPRAEHIQSLQWAYRWMSMNAGMLYDDSEPPPLEPFTGDDEQHCEPAPLSSVTPLPQEVAVEPHVSVALEPAVANTVSSTAIAPTAHREGSPPYCELPMLSELPSFVAPSAEFTVGDPNPPVSNASDLFKALRRSHSCSHPLSVLVRPR